jgi:hypothetical protein
MNTKHTLKYAEEPGLDELVVVKKFNEWLVQCRDEPVPGMLFGGLWLEGEMAVMASESGAGKSLLAVQIAESIAGGKAFAPFEATARPQKVLYLNLKLSQRQFAVRYYEKHEGENGQSLRNRYTFPTNLIRVDINIHSKLPDGYKTFDEILPPLIERLAHKNRAKVVIIDNITVLQRSVYGYRETYALMKKLDELKGRVGLSILVLARSSGYGSQRESSSSTLFSRFADSVFMIGKSRLDPSARFIKQLFARSSGMIYDPSHVASFVIKQLKPNFLGFEHYGFGAESEHHQPVRDDRLWPTIDRVKKLSDEGKSIRDIAAELDLPKSNIHRYLQMWTGEIGNAIRPQPVLREADDPTQNPFYFPGCEEYDQASRDLRLNNLCDDGSLEYHVLNREGYLIEAARARAKRIYKKTGVAPRLTDDPVYSEFKKIVVEGGDPFANGRSEDLRDEASLMADEGVRVPPGIPTETKHSLDAYGKDIWIEGEVDNLGRPVVWYSFDSKGRVQKHVRNSGGVSITREEKPEPLIYPEEYWDKGDEEEAD